LGLPRLLPFSFWRTLTRRDSLPEHDANAAPPILVEADARHLDFRGKVFQNPIGRTMKAKRRSHQPDERRARIQL